MKKFLLLLAVVAMGCLAAGAAMAGPSSPSPATLSSTQPALDPYLGGVIDSKVPMAKNCSDTIPSVCQNLAPGDSCDSPVGCVCGYSSGRLRCGRF